MGDKPTIAISHLGCEKNRIDTEHILGLLVEAGYSVDTNEDLADYVIVNTSTLLLTSVLRRFLVKKPANPCWWIS